MSQKCHGKPMVEFRETMCSQGKKVQKEMMRVGFEPTRIAPPGIDIKVTLT